MCLGIAVISEDTVSQILSNETTGFSYYLGATPLIYPNDLPEVLRVELRRKGGGADEVAEHHCELAPFSKRRRHINGRSGAARIRVNSWRGVKFGQRIADTQAMTRARHTNILQRLIIDLLEQI